MTDATQIAHPYEDYYDSIYRQLDPALSGVITSGAVVELLKTSGLPIAVLGAIWEEADYAKRGSLDRRGLFIALKLVSAAQSGHAPTSAVLMAPLGPPKLAGQIVPGPPSVGGVSPGGMSGASAWGIGPADQAKYDAIFDSLGPEGGKLPGSKVRPVLLNSGLNPTVLAKIWELADQDRDGFLDRVEFHVALHLVYRSLQGESLPRSLPDHLIHPSKATLTRRNSISSASGAIRSRAGSVNSLNEMSQYTTPTHSMPPPGANRPYSVQAPRPPSLTPQNTGGFPSGGGMGDWPVRVGEYAEHFAHLDTDRDGLVSGVDCRPFLLSTGMAQHLLAHVWSLVDIPQSGMLSLEQFALLLHLISLHSSGEELPSVLPSHLIPPSLRTPSAAPPDAPSEPSTPLEDDDEARAILDDISKLEEERRKADEEMAEIESQMRAKQTQMKQLQVELKTLEGTVKQLEKQKAEANRRLGEMDDQRARLLQSSEGNKAKAAETQKRLEQLMNDTERATASQEEDAVRISTLNGEVIGLEQAANEAESDLRRELQALEGTVGELSRMEREAQALEKEKEKAERVNTAIEGTIKELDGAIEGSSTCSALYDDFSRFSLFDTPSTSTPQPHPSAYPKGGVPPDPFASSAPSGLPSAAFSAPSGGKAPPPRPAPPATKKTPVNEDPFANADPFSGVDSAGANATTFADFANFGTFS